jgi:AmmeMemoRadiSam system protein B/AmmeMemoRadiSam system protein A
MQMIRPAAVAGMFYPERAAALRAQLDDYLAEAAPEAARAPAGAPPKLLIAPHAGYVYSGPIAARAFARLTPHGATIRRVVLLGPTHRVGVRGLAAPTVDAFETPLGRVPLDRAALDDLAALPQVVTSDRVHAQEHALEVQLPFLQRVLPGGFGLVPLAVGDAEPAEVAEVLDRLWGGAETLIVISSDLSHYLPYADAQARDRRTVERILARETDLVGEEACGAHALNGALLAARRRGLAPELLDLRNSGDTAGDRRRVVGYAAFAATAPSAGVGVPGEEEDTPATLGEPLLSRARNAIGQRFGLTAGHEPGHPALAAPGATFVTLKDGRGALRGCIGRLEADTSLEADVRRNAQAAAFADPRFAPLTAREWPTLSLSVSLLGPHEPLPAMASAAEAAAALQPGEDGLVLAWRGRRATFLPQVWEQLPRAEQFLAELLRKAGLPAGFWAEDVSLSRYTVRHFEGAALPAGRLS